MLNVGNTWMFEISVCIPTYEFKGQGVKYLSEIFDGLKKQTFQDFEIVISDHSEDTKIYDFCKKSSKEFSITYIKNPNDRGYQASNINCLIENAEGKIIKLIMQDDLFVDDMSLEKIKNSFDESGCKWLFHGFTHTTDGIETHRDCIPEWADMLLQGNNLLGSPSCIAFLNESKMYFDGKLKLLVDTEFYHRMRMEHGLPYIIPDILIANREHEARTSVSGIDYDLVLHGNDGRRWLVNSQELNYLQEKHIDFYKLGKYPDET
jgi:glycosyltransferase involved in cell wall biosynthesis